VSHPPLTAELGAAQTALNLAAALRGRGHDAVAWSPMPLPAGTRWWNVWQRQRRAIERFAAAAGPFDVIDTPALSASRELTRHGRLVVRSIQPELLYQRHDVVGDLRRLPTPRALLHALLAGRRAAAIVSGWRRASFILCMGSLELARMRRRFPAWTAKMGAYVCAPSPADQKILAELARRRKAPRGEGLRFLWIGRWAGHKGTGRLLRFLGEHLAASPADRFTLAGCGPAAALDVPLEWISSGRVRLVPAFPRSDLPDLLAEHDAGLFTSAAEGWGLSLNEMLESGMPVFATEAGGVADLKPFFQESLHPFPPPADRIEPWPPPEDLEANGYFARFNWAAIARSYEEQVLGPSLHVG
jgi:glycosyltransferase involved in cell wall biosynthesis